MTDKIVTRPKTADERVWRNEYLLKLEQEGLTPIKEDTVCPKKSLRYALYQPAILRPISFQHYFVNSIEDVPVLTPTYPSSPKIQHSIDDGDLLEPSISSYLNVRPRRRRDSTFIPSNCNTISSIDFPIHPTLDASPESKPPKRKFEFEDSSPQRRMSFGGASTIDEAFTYKVLSDRREQSTLTKELENYVEAAADVVSGRLGIGPWSAVDADRRLSGKSDGGESHKENKPQDEGNSTYLLTSLDKAEERKKRISLAGVSGNAMPVLSPPQLQRECIDPEEFADIGVALKPRKGTTTAASRKVLGPKTANSGPAASSQKPTISEPFSDPLVKLKALDFNPENQPLVTTVCPTENEAYPLVETITGTRLSRRTTANPINYALPRLNTKLRRETLEPEKPKKLRTSGGRKSREGSADRNKERENRSHRTDTDPGAGIRREQVANEDLLVLEKTPRGRITTAPNLSYPQSVNECVDLSSDKLSSVDGGRIEDLERAEGDYQGIISAPAKRVSMGHFSQELPEERERGRSSFVGAKSSTGGIERRRSMMV